MKLILGLSLVWTLLSAAAALKCHCTNAQCSVTTGQNCTTEKHCVTAAFEVFELTGTTQQSIQSCAPDAICPSNGLFTFSLSTTTASASSAFNCCSTDNCNSGNSLQLRQQTAFSVSPVTSMTPTAPKQSNVKEQKTPASEQMPLSQFWVVRLQTCAQQLPTSAASPRFQV
ncbi:uncharacterized protein LOC114854071 isoform X5 [Betta splendens]|uniref:Uncharacterized protein LOC114854071 isoform X5 n=1 Tax=Betta splendens TaxID=158456 RepID=A0A6P7MCG6_BETSP|nr:uncharacterized protein LOC114854071 isoform X5 [Betta splendens]